MRFTQTCPRWPQSSHWTVFFLYFVSRISWTFPAEGQSRVIGSPHPIKAAPGDDVILPCHLEPRGDAWWLTLEWRRTEPQDGAPRGSYVYFRRGGVELTDMKIPAYGDRAALFGDELRRGNVSLRISGVTLADEGTYRCFVPSAKSYAFVRLVVGERETWTTAAPTLTTADLQTTDPGFPTDANDGQRRVIWVLPAVIIASILAAAAVFIVRLKRCRCDGDAQKKRPDDAASGLVVAATRGTTLLCVEDAGEETSAARGRGSPALDARNHEETDPKSRSHA